MYPLTMILFLFWVLGFCTGSVRGRDLEVTISSDLCIGDHKIKFFLLFSLIISSVTVPGSLKGSLEDSSGSYSVNLPFGQ